MTGRAGTHPRSTAVRTGGLLLLAVAAAVAVPATAARAADDLPPFEMLSERQETEPDQSVTVRLLFESDVDVDDVVGVLEARKVGADADPVPPDDIVENAEGFGGELFFVRFAFPSPGTWEVIAFPGVADRAALAEAGYPDRLVFDVNQPPPGWVVPVVAAGIAGLMIALFAAAVAGNRSRPTAAPWDRTGTAGNPLSREPR